MLNNISEIPIGLDYLYSALRKAYPEQPNPLQVAARVKYWLGGPDPLDYISMYYNKGDESIGVASHWHYVSFGLSDLHGDGRVHERNLNRSAFLGHSGLGFEITMRIKCNKGSHLSPPTWPASLMQSLAKYIMQSNSLFCNGDHISWHTALDKTNSKVEHMLLSEDCQLKCVHTPLGSVKFLQIVGVMQSELQAAQKWNGHGIMNIMRKIPSCGGEWLVTDMDRKDDIFDIDSSINDVIENGIEKEGSDLSGVSAKFLWSSIDGLVPNIEANLGFSSLRIPRLYQEPFSQYSDSSIVLNHIQTKNFEFNVWPPIKVFSSLHLTINFEAAALLPCALRGRLKHDRHFSLQDYEKSSVVTFVTTEIEGAFVNTFRPYAVRSSWLQILIRKENLEKVIDDLNVLNSESRASTNFPQVFSWSNLNLKITVLQG